MWIDIECFHIITVNCSSICWLCVPIAIRMEGWETKVSGESGIWQPSRGQFELFEFFSELLFLFIVEFSILLIEDLLCFCIHSCFLLSLTRHLWKKWPLIFKIKRIIICDNCGLTNKMRLQVNNFPDIFNFLFKLLFFKFLRHYDRHPVSTLVFWLRQISCLSCNSHSVIKRVQTLRSPILSIILSGLISVLCREVFHMVLIN